MNLSTNVGTPPHVGHLRTQGWALLPSLGVTATELAEARGLIDGLFDRFDELPKDRAVDLGANAAPGRPAVPEIGGCSLFEPRLRRTAVWRAAHRVARDVLGMRAFALGDHAIYKPPGTAGVTSWHQDAAFDSERDAGLALWIPFQDTGVLDGCMRYVTGSHLGGRVEHQVRMGPNDKVVHVAQADEAAVEDVTCPAGGATMHDFFTVHGAGANVGDQVRRAWIIDFTTGSPLRLVGRPLKTMVRALRG